MSEGFQKSAVGVVPADWEVKPLGNVFTLKHGFAFSSEHFSASGPIVLTPGNFRLDGGLYFEPRNTKRYAGNYSLATRFRKGDLLIVMTDLTPGCHLLGKPAFIESDEAILHNQRIGKVELKAKSIDLRFLYFTLLSGQYLHRIREKATGSTVRHTSSKSIYSIQIAWPTFPEQCAIAAALSDVDALLAELDALIAKKRDLKQAAMQQLLTGQTRLPGFSRKWEVKRLGDVATFHKGKGLPKSALFASGVDPCIHYGELFTRYRETIGAIISRTNGLGDSFRSLSNDVLMPTSDVTPRGLAKASCVPFDNVILGGDILVIRADKQRLDGSFLSYVIRREEHQVLQLVSGSTVFHLYGSDMKKFSFSMPPITEQAAIGTVLSDMDAELTALEGRRDKTRALKQGMMQELLTGRIRLIDGTELSPH
ncbi:MAG: Restriction endonuclease [Ramlibacter sp.]|nr:Restriction endonuclease [Ramlibacter sp.]